MKRKQSPTNELTKAVITWLNLQDNYVWRQNTQATFDPIRKVRIGGVVKKGIADIIGVNKVGTHIEIEIKSKYERLSKEQKQHGYDIIKHEGIYLVVRSFDEFEKFWTDDSLTWQDLIQRLDKEKVKPDKK